MGRDDAGPGRVATDDGRRGFQPTAGVTWRRHTTRMTRRSLLVLGLGSLLAACQQPTSPSRSGVSTPLAPLRTPEPKPTQTPSVGQQAGRPGHARPRAAEAGRHRRLGRRGRPAGPGPVRRHGRCRAGGLGRPDLPEPGDVRREHEDRAVPGRSVAGLGRPADLDLHAAPGRPVPRRQRVRGRGRQVLVRAGDGAATPPVQEPRSARSRRSSRRGSTRSSSRSRAPYAPFLATLAALRGSAIVPRRWMQGAGAAARTSAVGSGPFRIAEYVPGSHIRYVQAPRVLGEGAAVPRRGHAGDRPGRGAARRGAPLRPRQVRDGRRRRQRHSSSAT